MRGLNEDEICDFVGFTEKKVSSVTIIKPIDNTFQLGESRHMWIQSENFKHLPQYFKMNSIITLLRFSVFLLKYRLKICHISAGLTVYLL